MKINSLGGEVDFEMYPCHVTTHMNATYVKPPSKPLYGLFRWFWIVRGVEYKVSQVRGLSRWTLIVQGIK